MSNSKLALILAALSAFAGACALDVEEPDSLSESESHLLQTANTNFTHATPSSDSADPSADVFEAGASACTRAGATRAAREAWCWQITDVAVQEECWEVSSAPLAVWLAWCSD